MAMDLNFEHPVALNAFDVSRENALSASLPPFRVGDQPSTSTTRSRYRLRWNQLYVWDDFGDRVSDYWNTVPHFDRTNLVANYVDMHIRWRSIANDPRILSEEDIKVAINSYPIHLHRSAANGFEGAPLPADEHSVADRSAPGASQFGLAGVPDFVMHHLGRVTVLMEAKNPWLVTPQRIDEVIDGNCLIQAVLLTCRYRSYHRCTSWTSCRGTTLRVPDAQRQNHRHSLNNEGMVFSLSR